MVKLSVFPEECKIATLKILFKKASKTDLKNHRPISSKTDLKNHRPISLLPLMSKIIEKSIHYQLQDYV